MCIYYYYYSETKTPQNLINQHIPLSPSAFQAKFSLCHLGLMLMISGALNGWREELKGVNVVKITEERRAGAISR